MSSSSPTDIQRIFRALPGLFLAIKPDEDFTILAISEELLRVTHTKADLIGRPLFDVFPQNGPTAEARGEGNLRESLQRVIATRMPDRMPVQRYDVRLPASLGGEFEEHYWSPINAPVLSEDGEVEYIIQRVEAAAAKANTNAIAILESITEGFFTLDRQWRFDYANAEAHRILGVEKGALRGQEVWALFPGMEATDFELNFRRSMEERQKTSFTAHDAKQGRWFDVTTFPAPEGMSVYFRDVSAHKRMEMEREALQLQSEWQRRMFDAALNSTPDFVYVFDTDHRALYANAALLRTWGVDEVRGKRWMDLGYEQWHADLHDQEIDRVINTAAPIRGEIPFTGTNGQRIYDYIFAPVFDVSGKVVAVAGTTRDITDRKADERAVREQAQMLAEADRAKTEFLATLSHELRNPLAPLRNAIELFRRAGQGDEKSVRLHAIMDRQVSHMIRLVDDLLEISRISRGALTLRKERVDLDAILRNAAETSDPAIRAGRHALTIEASHGESSINGDPVRLTQILSNLLNNAALYSEPGGQVVVRSRREGSTVVISVADQGIGIDAATLPRLFEMFSRGHRDRTRNQGGLGIGLALARRLAEMHGGTLHAHSEGLGRGSEFTLTLPLAAEKGASPAQELSVGKGLLNQLGVLVIDDNQDAADTLAHVLAEMGATVSVAHSGPEGLRAFASARPAVVLLDIGMPGMNGYEVARAIRSQHPEHRTTLIALTGWGQENDREQARGAGFDHHLVKPADLLELQKLLVATQAIETRVEAGARE